MSHHVGNIGTQDLAALRGVLHQHTESPGPTLESIASEIKGLLASLVRHSDKDLKVGTVRPDHATPREDKFTAQLKHIMQELQQLLSGTTQKFKQCGNEPGQGPHHPPPQGPHGHGLPPVFKELQAAVAKFESAESELRSAKKAENKMEIALYGHTIPAETTDTKNARKGVTSAEAGLLKALLHMVERLAGHDTGHTKPPAGKPVKESISIDDLMNVLMQAMNQPDGVADQVEAKIGDPSCNAPHGTRHSVGHVALKPILPPAFKEFAKGVVNLEVAKHKLHAAQARDDKEERLETRLFGAPVNGESVATTHAKDDVASAKAEIIAALHKILAKFETPGTDPIGDPTEEFAGGDDPLDGSEGVDDQLVGTEPVSTEIPAGEGSKATS